MISSVRYDGRKEIQSTKLAWPIYIQSLRPASYPIPKGIIDDVNEHAHMHTRTHSLVPATPYLKKKPSWRGMGLRKGLIFAAACF